jgi:hypothetical protein
MKRNRLLIVLLAIVTILAMATAALAARSPDKGRPDKPEPPPIWRCEDRVANDAVWVPGAWDGSSYVSDADVRADIPLCIDIEEEHRTVENWTVTWEGTARKDPKGLMFIFEEEVHAAHYAELEVLPTAGDDILSGTAEMTPNFGLDDDGTIEHMVFVAMGRQGDKWTDLTFTATPHP